MEEALQLIAYQRDKLKESRDYIKALELIIKAMGGAMVVLAVAVLYVWV